MSIVLIYCWPPIRNMLLSLFLFLVFFPLHSSDGSACVGVFRVSVALFLIDQLNVTITILEGECTNQVNTISNNSLK